MPVIAKQIPTTMAMPIINYVSLNSVPYDYKCLSKVFTNLPTLMENTLKILAFCKTKRYL